MNPLAWDEWVKLPVRDFDFSISTPRLLLRVPTVIVSTQYDRMPLRMPRVTRAAIFERDRGVCQYSGEFVGKNGGNLDHVVPRDRGGRDSFENLVWSKKEINSLKANRLPHEAGLRLRKPPVAPRVVPATALIRNYHGVRDWQHFLG